MIPAYINEDRQYRNPFTSDLARANSSYSAFQHNTLVQLLNPEQAPTPLMEYVHDAFRSLVLNPRFSCVGAKAAIRRGTYRFGLYGEMNAPGSSAGLARDLFAFVQEQTELNEDFTTFAASFTGPQPTDAKDFEQHLWAQLQSLYEQDRVYHQWDPSVASNPQDPRFAFSFAGRAFFVVGLSALSWRWTRRFAWPTLIFNAHHQFDHLRERGKFTRMQETIRKRDYELQGSINATLSDFGVVSEARQYAGRPVEEGWRCPFVPHQQHAEVDNKERFS